MEKKDEEQHDFYNLRDQDELLQSDKEEGNEEETDNEKRKKKTSCTPTSMVKRLKEKDDRQKKRINNFTYGSSKKAQAALDIEQYMTDEVQEKWSKMSAKQENM